MIDTDTKQRLLVHCEGDAGPYIMLPLDQLAEVSDVLKRNGIAFWVAKDAISLDGSPVIAVIEFGRAADAMHIQGVLDAAG